MPRNYTRKSNRGEWSEEDLRAAAAALSDTNRSANSVAKEYGIPLRTLLRRVHNNNLEKGSLGPTGCLGKENEEQLCKYIQRLEKLGYAPISRDIRGLAYSFAEKNNIKCKFNTETKLAGYDWFTLFMKRHPNLRMRVAQGRSIARSLGMSHAEVDPYFQLLYDTLDQYDLRDKPRKIFNMDETGLQLCNKPGKVIATKGSKDVHTLTSAEKGETVSVIACCNAEGYFLPPYVIFRGTNKKKEFEDGMPPGSAVVMSPESAYVNTRIFSSWIRDHFLPRKEPGPVVLILDGHSSHCSDVNVLDFLAENDIHVICLPSHTTHWLQPLDRSFFKPLKSYWNKACSQWVRNHPGRRITRYQFGSLLNEAWKLAASNDNGVSGFRACGVFPPDQTKIPEYAYAIADHISGHPDNGAEVHVTGDTPSNASTPSESLNGSSAVSFEEISPIPSIPGPSRINNRKQHAELLTSLEVRSKKRQKLEEKQRKAAEKERKKNAKTIPVKPSSSKKGKKSKKPRESSSSDESEAYNSVVSDHSSDGVDSDNEDFCIVCKGYYHDKNGPKVDWICCIKCKKWLHETCTSDPNKCDNCAKNS